jgi:hypothetical protein
VIQCPGIQMYSLEDDEWSTLTPTPRHASAEGFRGLDHWQSQLYAVSQNEQATLSAWKLDISSGCHSSGILRGWHSMSSGDALLATPP